MLDKIKVALRISHTRLDEDIRDTIDTARSEMIRAGVPVLVAQGNNPLVESAIKTYALYIYANDTKQADGYFKSWQYQLDCIRKSGGVVDV